MSQRIHEFKTELNEPLRMVQFPGIMASGDRSGDIIRVLVYQDGEPVTLTGSILGYVIDPAGATWPVTGVKDGNGAQIQLPQEAYALQGQIQIAIRETVDTTITTLLVATTSVLLTQTGTVYDPGDVIPMWDDVVTKLEAMEEATDAANAAADNAVGNFAGSFNAATAYTAGQYVIYPDDGKLYRLTADHAANTTWANTSKVQVTVGEEVSKLKGDFESAGIQTIMQSPYLTQGYIDSNGKWANRASGNPRCAIIPVSGGESLSITAGTTTTQIAALKSFSNPADATAADYSAATGWTSIIQVSTNTNFSGTIPSDASYLYVWLGNVTGYARKPTLLAINGYDFVQSAKSNFQKIATEKAPIASPIFTGTPKSVTPGNDSSLTDIATAQFVKNVALNISQYALQIGTDSTNKTDIDALRTSGTYRVLSSTNAGNVIGHPPTTSIAYKLVVMETTQTDRVYQIALLNSATMPIRYRYYGNNGWTDWHLLTLDFTSFEGSRNLIPATAKSYTGQGVTRSYEDGVISLNNAATSSGGKSSAVTDNFTLKAGKYTLSLSYINLKALSCFLRDTDGNDIANVVNILNPVTFTLGSAKTCYIGVNVTSGTDYSGKKVKIQLEKSADQHAFEKPSFQTAVDSDAREQFGNILSAFSNIECAGDSLTYGAVYTSDSSYRQANKPYPNVLGHITGATMTALATPGSNASEWWTEYSNSISAKTNALAIIFLGTNGGLTDTISTDVSGNDPTQWANTHTGNYARIVKAYLTAGYKVLLVKCFMTSASADLDTTNSVIQQMADKFGCGVIDNEYMDNISYHYTPDRTYANTLHYNDLGYAAMAYRIAENAGKMSEKHKAYIIPE